MERLAYYTPDPQPLRITTTLPWLVMERAEKSPTKEAYVFRVAGETRRAITFGDLATLSKNAGRGLLGLQLEKGERVGIIGPNCPEWLVSYFGAVFAGLLVLRMKVDLLDSAEQFRYLINRHQVTALIVYPGVRGEIMSRLCKVLEVPNMEDGLVTCPKTPGLKHVISMIPTKGCIDLNSLPSDATVRPDPLMCRVQMVDASDMLEGWFTSGTTGTPKAVVYSHQSMLNIFDSLRDICTQDSVFWNDRSYAWIASLSLMPMVIGCTLVTSPTESKLEEILRVVREENTTVALFLPYILSDILEYQKNNSIVEPLSGVKRVLCGGERIPKDLAVRWLSIFPELINCYGGTETGFVASSPIRDDVHEKSLEMASTDEVDAGSSTATDSLNIRRNYEVKIVGPNDEGVAVGAIGEVCVRSPLIFMGYLDADEQTPDSVDDSGWFHTGDLGRLSDDDCLTLVGRMKNVISRGIAKIYPVSVENVIMEHPEVAKVCAIGIPHPRLFEEICACVVLIPSSLMTSQDIMKFFIDRHTSDTRPENMPDHVICLEDIPLNSNGKVDTILLKEKAMKYLNR